jgi:DNA polymerase III delta subunit
VIFISGDDDWFVAEAARRVAAAFRKAFAEGEVTEYEGTTESVREAVADAATIALFSTNRLVVLEASELFRVRKLTAEEIDGLLDEAAEAGVGGAAMPEPRVLTRLTRKARALAASAGVALDGDSADAARRIAGRVKRSERASELAALLSLPMPEADAAEGESAAERLVDYASRARSSDNVLLVHAVSPDPGHRATQALSRAGVAADFTAGDDGERRERLAALGLDRALERHVSVEPEVFDLLTNRGRLSARPFLSELDRLIDTAAGTRVTEEHAARLVENERKDYGSDFVELVAKRQPLAALKMLERLLGGGEFSAFRPYGAREDSAPARKGPRGDAAFFPLLGLLAGEIRRMLAIRAALAERGGAGASRRLDYRTFADRLLPDLKSPRPGLPPFVFDAHPFVLHKAYLAALDWTAADLRDALLGLEAIDRGVKSGAGSGRELLEAFLLARAGPAAAVPA